MIGGALLFVLGAVSGGVAVVINQRMVEEQTAALKKENQRLQKKIHEDRVEYESARAYRKGYYEGVRCKGKKAGKGNKEGNGDE